MSTAEAFPKLLTEAEVAELLRTSVGNLRRARRAGDGPPSIRLGSVLLFDETELRDWISSTPRRVDPVEAALPIGNGARRRLSVEAIAKAYRNASGSNADRERTVAAATGYTERHVRRVIGQAREAGLL